MCRRERSVGVIGGRSIGYGYGRVDGYFSLVVEWQSYSGPSYLALRGLDIIYLAYSFRFVFSRKQFVVLIHTG